MSTQEKPILEGVLMKRATKGGVRWATRYFRLYSNRLTYSTKSKGRPFLRAGSPARFPGIPSEALKENLAR